MDEAILSRHAESEYSVRGAVNGDPGVPVGLTAEGREQARRLGELLRDATVELCVTSEFPRARQTADLALAGRDVPRVALADLNEIRFGEYEDRAFEDYRVWAGTALPDAEGHGGESRVAAARRYARGFRAVLERSESHILVVTHGLPIRYVLNALDGIAPAPLLDAVPYAQAHRVSARALAEAVHRLEDWCAAPAW
jgi:broad specificity phosphatase PhoE